MNFIKKVISSSFIAISLLGAVSSTAFAEETVNTANVGSGELINHIEQALAEIQVSNFSIANMHLKAARAVLDEMTNDDAAFKKAKSNLLQGQIQAKKGNIKSSSELLNKALSFFKSL